MRFNAKGFTLLEVLMASLFFVVSVVGIARAFQSGLLAARTSEGKGTSQEFDLALSIAEAQMETLKDMSFASLADSGPSADAAFTSFDVTVDVLEGTDPMRVDVTVEGDNSSVTLTTLMADI